MQTETVQESIEYDVNTSEFENVKLEHERREFALLNLISSLQKELFHTKSLFNNWRNNHILEDNQLRTIIIDPTVNLEIKELKQKIFEKDEVIRKTRENLQALKFNPHKSSANGLIKKCQALGAENRSLGKFFVDNKLQPFSILLTNKNKMIEALKSELKQLRELNHEIDQDNSSLTNQLTDLVKLYSAAKEEKEKLSKEVETLQAALAETQTADINPIKISSPAYSKTSHHFASPRNGTHSPARISRRKIEKDPKYYSDKNRDKGSDNKKSRGRSKERTRDRSNKDSHRDSDRNNRRKPKTDKYRDRD